MKRLLLLVLLLLVSVVVTVDAVVDCAAIRDPVRREICFLDFYQFDDGYGGDGDDITGWN